MPRQDPFWGVIASTRKSKRSSSSARRKIAGRVMCGCRLPAPASRSPRKGAGGRLRGWLGSGGFIDGAHQPLALRIAPVGGPDGAAMGMKATRHRARAAPPRGPCAMPDGSPQLTQTWVDRDGEHIALTSRSEATSPVPPPTAARNTSTVSLSVISVVRRGRHTPVGRHDLGCTHRYRHHVRPRRRAEAGLPQFVREVVTTYEAVAGSAGLFRFLQLRVRLVRPAAHAHGASHRDVEDRGDHC